MINEKAANVVFGFLCVCFEFDLIWLVNCIFNFFSPVFAIRFVIIIVPLFLSVWFSFFLFVSQHYFPRCSFTFFFKLFLCFNLFLKRFLHFSHINLIDFFDVNYTIKREQKKSMISKRTKIKTGKKYVEKIRRISRQ